MITSFLQRLSLATLTLIIFACGPSRNINLTVTRPAEISFPSDTRTLLLVDRTKFESNAVNTLEGILTGELPADDRVAAQEALVSLKNRLNTSPRFEVKLFPDRLTGNSLTAAFPAALTWAQVNRLCTTNNAEVLISLEIFDSDFIVTNGTRIKKRFEGEGTNRREVEFTEYYAQGLGNLKMGIRVYHNASKTIVDQQLFDEKKSWEAVGKDATDAAALLISKSEANRFLARLIGDDYAYKVAPLPITIDRDFYGRSKHCPAVATGTRYADVNQWAKAIDEWKAGLNTAETKDAGKLAYNIAIGYEVLGEYGTALTWARDAYTKYGNKPSREYSSMLEARIRDEKLLKQQMEK